MAGSQYKGRLCKVKDGKVKQWAGPLHPPSPSTCLIHTSRSRVLAVPAYVPSRELERNRGHGAGHTHSAQPGEYWGGGETELGPSNTPGEAHAFLQEAGNIPEPKHQASCFLSEDKDTTSFHMPPK